jgi:6-phosphofructokinase 1
MELLNEDGVDLDSLQRDIETLRRGFAGGKKLGIVIISEGASPYYDTEFVRRIMEAEARGAFEVRQTILGHLQRGGVPTAFDRIQGSRLGAHAARQIMEDIAEGRADVSVIGIEERGVVITSFQEASSIMDWACGRPREQSFMLWRRLADTLAKPGPGAALPLP